VVREAVARAVLAWRARVRHMPRTRGTGGATRAAAVQMRIWPHRSGDEFAAHVGDLVQRAVDRGAGLIVFPEDTATGLLGMLPGFDRAGPPGGVSVADILTLAGPYVERVYTTVFSRLAARHRATIVAGTALLPRNGRVYNLAHVFGPDGSLIGVQPKIHLFPHEAGWGIAAGDDLRVWRTPHGRLAVPVCMDATYFETFRVAAKLGATVAAVPTADPDTYNVWKKRRGAWARAQDGGLPVVNACLFGAFAGITLTGRSACYAPLHATPDGSGILAEVADPDAEGVAVAELVGGPAPVAPPSLLQDLADAYRLALGARGTMEHNAAVGPYPG
jgi:predicted amidohydrolase